MVEIRSCEYNFTDEFRFVLFASCVADFADDIIMLWWMFRSTLAL